MLCGSLDERGVWRENGFHICVWLSPFTAHVKLSQHCLLDILQYKINFFFFKKKEKAMSLSLGAVKKLTGSNRLLEMLLICGEAS